MSENPVLQSSRASEGAAVGRAPRVLVLCQMFYPELISTGQVLTSLCEELRELGADVEVVCGPPTIVDQQSEIPRDIEHLGIRIHRVWSTRFSKLTFWGKLANQLSFAISVFGELLRRDGGRPILVLTEPPFLAALCVALKWWRGDPFVYLIFDLYPDVAVATG
ncbi:MAG: hypothetical protein KC609_12285, partial [Myxococcales bacterium]|nr:hypothetical protein [Myxococcales bacterium]